MIERSQSKWNDERGNEQNDTNENFKFSKTLEQGTDNESETDKQAKETNERTSERNEGISETKVRTNTEK